MTAGVTAEVYPPLAGTEEAGSLATDVHPESFRGRRMFTDWMAAKAELDGVELDDTPSARANHV